jgi:hypothetical protein
MILPTKHITTHRSLLGSGATILRKLDRPRTISSLWEEVRRESNVGSYHRYIFALDLLYILGAVEMQNGLVRRLSK